MQIEVGPPFRRCRGIVTHPWLAKRCRVPMLDETRMVMAEVGKGLGLYTLGFHAVRGAPELIPLLAHNVVAQQVTAVHREVLEPPPVPYTQLLKHIMDAKQEHGR